jgi:hypothetical protein
MPAEPKTLFRATSVNILTANADRAKAQQPRPIYLSKRSRDMLYFCFAVTKGDYLDSAGIVSPMPLPI